MGTVLLRKNHSAVICGLKKCLLGNGCWENLKPLFFRDRLGARRNIKVLTPLGLSKERDLITAAVTFRLIQLKNEFQRDSLISQKNI